MLIDFNSTMVRLKVVYNSLSEIVAIYFNSTMVRLKDWAGMGFVFYLVHFNSTMVRLKGCILPNNFYCTF